MKLIDIRDKPWDPIDLVRRRRAKYLLIWYWIFTSCVGVALIAIPLDFLQILLREPLSWADGITSLAIKSFDQRFLEVFLALTMMAAFVFTVIGWIWVPAGSEKQHGSLISKMFLILCNMLILMGLASMVFMENDVGGLNDGRASGLLYLGASSFFGSVTILNFLFGFGWLFFALTLKATVFAKIANSDDSLGI